MTPVFKKILCTTDFSEGSYLVLDVACRLASQEGAELLLMYSVPFPAPNPKGFKTEAEARQQAIADARAELEKIIREQFSSCSNARAVVGSGNAAHQIVSVARKEDIDVVVISTQGKTGWRRLLLGSVAEEVLRTAPCPVLTVRQSEEEAVTRGMTEAQS